MAKSTSDKAKTTKTPAAKKTAAPKAATPKAAAPKAAAPKAAPKKAAAKPKATVDPGENLVKKCQDAVAKFEKLNDEKYSEIKEKLEWCIGSYEYDKNPAGLVEYGQKAIGALKEIKTEKPKLVSAKLVGDLEKAVASMA